MLFIHLQVILEIKVKYILTFSHPNWGEMTIWLFIWPSVSAKQVSNINANLHVMGLTQKISYLAVSQKTFQNTAVKLNDKKRERIYNYVKIYPLIHLKPLMRAGDVA